MTEYTSSHRRQDMGADTFDKEQQEAERAAAKGEERERKKREKRERLEKDPTYNFCSKISRWMDKFYLDPIIGLIPGGVGDIVSLTLTVPFIYVAATKIKSIPLTLAIIYNSLVDMLIGAIPVLGDIIDFFNKNHKKNYKLLTGFIEDDKEIKHEVNKKAIFCGIAIAILIFLICLVLKFVGELIGYVWEYFTGLF
ncbi:MAG: DUF4112 domain-containing protein [Bacteroidales bacterium]|nr:DUF4112 domain-containing protein [Bacteroidales bacterium]